MKKKKIEFSTVIDLSAIKKHYKEVIHHCEFCNGIIIDHDNVPQEYIVNYDDRNIYSEVIHCEICNKEICRNCSKKIEDVWDVFYLCPTCSKDYEKQILKIESLQEREELIVEKIEKAIMKLRNAIPLHKKRKNNKKKYQVKPRRLNGRKRN